MPQLIYFITKKTRRLCYLKDQDNNHIIIWHEKCTNSLGKGYLSNDRQMKEYHSL